MPESFGEILSALVKGREKFDLQQMGADVFRGMLPLPVEKVTSSSLSHKPHRLKFWSTSKLHLKSSYF
jgi:hypothetical protein